jgi:hypothetical protein
MRVQVDQRGRNIRRRDPIESQEFVGGDWSKVALLLRGEAALLAGVSDCGFTRTVSITKQRSASFSGGLDVLEVATGTGQELVRPSELDLFG